MSQADAIVQRCKDLALDLDFNDIAAWKEANPDGKVVGVLPGYGPLEVIHAAGCLPVGIIGGGDALEIIRGDAYFQSYICHIPRSVIELGVGDHLRDFDGFVFPSTCDVIRNLSGMFQVLFADKYVKYFDVPQNFGPKLGGRFYRQECGDLARGLKNIGGQEVTDASLAASIALYDARRAATEALIQLRIDHPEKVPASELTLIMWAGHRLPVDEHTRMLQDYTADAATRERRVRDNPRVLLHGAFCEQPPIDLVRTLERAGCYLVEDDFVLQQRWIQGPILNGSGDPWGDLTKAFLTQSQPSAIRYTPEGGKGDDIVARVERTGAEGVIFASPSFCDPSLLDLPMLTAALDDKGIPWTEFKYAENTGQFQGIREQAGTFSDSIRLWSEA